MCQGFINSWKLYSVYWKKFGSSHVKETGKYVLYKLTEISNVIVDNIYLSKISTIKKDNRIIKKFDKTRKCS